MEHGVERSGDGIEVEEVHYDRVARDELPTLMPLVVVLPESWGDTIEIHYAIQRADDRDDLRATWQPEQLRARVTVGSTSVFAVGDRPCRPV